MAGISSAGLLTESSRLEAAVQQAVEQGWIEINALDLRVRRVIDELREHAAALRAWDSDAQSPTQAFIELSNDASRRFDEHLKRQREILGTFNIAFFGRTGAGKSTLLSAMGHLDGERVSQGESDWTVEVQPVDWQGCRLYDTPGINGWGRVRSRESLEEAARRAVEVSDVVLLCFDSQSQQMMEFQKVADWVRDYGKPVIAVVNVRNSRWRHPGKVPQQESRRHLSEMVRQHVQNIEGELVKIGLSGVPVVAVQSRRALMARAHSPYRGPDAVNHENNRASWGLDYLLEWSNLEVVEDLIAATVSTGGANLRLSGLREGVRSLLGEWVIALQRTAVDAEQQASVMEQSIKALLDTLGYPETERVKHLWSDRIRGDLLTVCENARRNPFTSPSGGSLGRHVQHLLKSHLGPVRARSLYVAEDLIRQAFDEGVSVSDKEFRRRVLDKDVLEDALGVVWQHTGDFLQREVGLSLDEASTDVRFLEGKRARVDGSAGKGLRFASNASKASGLLAGSTAAVLMGLAALNVWNPLGWAVGLVSLGLGVLGGVLKFVGTRARRKAEKARVTARSRALGEARRELNDFFDALEEEALRETHAAAWSGAAPVLRPLLEGATTLHMTHDRLEVLADSAGQSMLEIPTTPNVPEILEDAASEVVWSRGGSRRAVLLGENWIDSDFAGPSVQPYGGDEFADQAEADRAALEAALGAMLSGTSPAEVENWLARLEALTQEDASALEVLEACRDCLPPARAKVALIGDFSAGKSSLLKRLLVETGRPVPVGLSVRADPTTASVSTHDFGSFVLADAPGFQSGNSEHDQAAFEAVTGAGIVVFLLHVNLVIGDTTFLESIIKGSPTLAGKNGRVLFLVNRCDELGVDPSESPEEFLLRRRRKATELKSALAARDIQVADGQIHLVAADPFGLVGDRQSARSTDYQSEFKTWDGVQPLLDAFSSVSEMMSNAGPYVAALDLGATLLVRQSSAMADELALLKGKRESRRSVLRTLGAARRDAAVLRSSLAQSAQELVDDYSAEILADALAANPEELEAMADRLGLWWKDPSFVADTERYLRDCVTRVERWYSSYSSLLTRDVRAGRLQTDLGTIDISFEPIGREHTKKFVRHSASASRVASDASKAAASRDVVYGAGKLLGYKFKPWGAIRGASRFARAGAVLNVVAVGLDVASWVQEARAEGSREQARLDAATYVKETQPIVLGQILYGAQGDGPLPYLDSISEELSMVVKSLEAEDGKDEAVQDFLEAGLEARRDLLVLAAQLQGVGRETG